MVAHRLTAHVLIFYGLFNRIDKVTVLLLFSLFLSLSFFLIPTSWDTLECSVVAQHVSPFITLPLHTRPLTHLLIVFCLHTTLLLSNCFSIMQEQWRDVLTMRNEWMCHPKLICVDNLLRQHGDLLSLRWCTQRDISGILLSNDHIYPQWEIASSQVEIYMV